MTDFCGSYIRKNKSNQKYHTQYIFFTPSIFTVIYAVGHAKIFHREITNNPLPGFSRSRTCMKACRAANPVGFEQNQKIRHCWKNILYPNCNMIHLLRISHQFFGSGSEWARGSGLGIRIPDSGRPELSQKKAKIISCLKSSLLGWRLLMKPECTL